MNLTHRVAGPLEQWAVNSQRRARRNAMVAATELARRRAERIEVDAFLATRTSPARTAPAPTPRSPTSEPVAAHG